jgi:hypothetical protein
MTDISDEDLKVLVETMGKALGLPIGDDNASIVEAHLRVAFKMADFVGTFPLSDESESATVFSA